MTNNRDNDDVYTEADHAGPIPRPFPKGAYPEGSGQRPSKEEGEDWASPHGIPRPEIPKGRVRSFLSGVISRRI
jgi:hypothetical protein